MATTTPNYGWTVPTSTDLVKDGATAIETLGDSVDATVFANASAAINKTIVDAKGDIIAATAADTVSRLAVGANDTVLTADSTTATGLKWATAAAGGMTQLASGSLSGNTLSLTSISQSYVDLYLVLNNVKISAAEILFTTLNNDTSSVYDTIHNAMTNGTWTYVNTTSLGARNTFSTSVDGQFWIYLRNYTVVNRARQISGYQGIATSGRQFLTQFLPSTAAAIDRIDLQLDFSATFTAGTYKLYGVK